MKKTLPMILAFAITFFVASTPAFAISPTPAPTEAASDKSALSEKLNQEINNLKEKIASRVSELNLVEKRGIIGTVTEVSGNQITVTDMMGKTRFIDVDEITKFSSPGSKTFGLSDITKGTKITALGLYNKQSKRLLARFIKTSVDPIYVGGTIGDLDTKNFTITLLGDNQKQNKLDVQTTTKIFTYTKGDGLTKTGFTKLSTGTRAFAMGYPDKKDPTLVVTDRIIVIPSLPKNANVVIPEETEEPTATPAKKR